MKSNPTSTASTNTEKKADGTKSKKITGDKLNPSPTENYEYALKLLQQLQNGNQSPSSQLQPTFSLMFQYLCAAAICYWPENDVDDEEKKDKKSTPNNDQKAAKDALSQFKKIYFFIKKEECSWEKLPLNFNAQTFLEKNKNLIEVYLQQKPWIKTSSTSVQSLSTPTTFSSTSASVSSSSSSTTSTKTETGFGDLTDDDFVCSP